MNNPVIKNDVSILVNSCDKYSDVWPVFFTLFFKYWPDCPWKIYLGSNEKIFDDPRVITIRVGKDRSWSESAYKMLDNIPTTNILFFLEDFLIFKKVDTKKVLHFYDSFVSLKANCMRLRNSPVIDNAVIGFNDLVERPKGEKNRVALDIAFWKKEIFMGLLKFGETPWQMETEGSIRSIKHEAFYTSKEWIIERRNGLEGGKWLRYNLDLLNQEGILIPPGHEIMTTKEELVRSIDTFLWSLKFYQHLRSYKTRLGRWIKNIAHFLER